MDTFTMDKYGFNQSPRRAAGHPTTMDKRKALHTRPHYTDRRFKKEQTVFGKPAKTRYGHKGLEYVYSDRLVQWDGDKSDKAWDIAKNGTAPYRLFTSVRARADMPYCCARPIRSLIGTQPRCSEKLLCK